MNRKLVHINGSNDTNGAEVAARGPRIALYSHDTCGLGHLRRNLSMAEVLARPPLGARVLTIAGAAEAKLFPTPDGVDCLTLPALAKQADGGYRTRSLGVGLDELLEIRSTTIRAALKAFRPDLLIVDKVPRGALGELDSLLADLKRAGRTRLVLGLRDVLDHPERVRAEWDENDYEAAICRYYDEVWVYGDRDVYDAAESYGFSPSVREKVRYTGYFDRRHLQGQGSEPSSSGSTILCMVGGGQDGIGLAESFAAVDLPEGKRGLLISGPYMPEDNRRRLAELCASRPDMEMREFLTDPAPLIRSAERVIAMGGYNSVCEVLSHGKPLLVVPRVTPRKEQLVRAQRFRDLGLVDLCHPDLASPDVLGEWIARTPTARASHAAEHVDFGGLDRLPALAARLLGRKAEAAHGAPAATACSATGQRSRRSTA